MAQNNHADKNWTNASASAAPALLGAAAGVFLGDLMDRDNRRPVSLALAILGIVALAPSAVTSVVDKVNGPNSKRGSKRTLTGIRDAGYSAEDYSDLEEII